MLLIKGSQLTNSLHQDHLHIQRAHVSQTGTMHPVSSITLNRLHSILVVALLQERAWLSFGLPRETPRPLPIAPRCLVVCPAWKHGSILCMSRSSNQTVTFGYCQPGLDANRWPEGERLWSQLHGLPWLLICHNSDIYLEIEKHQYNKQERC